MPGGRRTECDVPAARGHHGVFAMLGEIFGTSNGLPGLVSRLHGATIVNMVLFD